MPCYHAGPMTSEEFEAACLASSVRGCHVVLDSGLEWCRHIEADYIAIPFGYIRTGWWRGLRLWFHLGMPRAAKEAVARRQGGA